MTGLFLQKSQTELQTFFFSSDPDHPSSGSLQVSARDFGYEIDEQELAEALMDAPLSSSPLCNTNEVELHDFESVYQWFLA